MAEDNGIASIDDIQESSSGVATLDDIAPAAAPSMTRAQADQEFARVTAPAPAAKAPTFGKELISPMAQQPTVPLAAVPVPNHPIAPAGDQAFDHVAVIPGPDGSPHIAAKDDSKQAQDILATYAEGMFPQGGPQPRLSQKEEERVGTESAADLASAQKYLVTPFEKAAKFGSDIGRDVATSAVAQATGNLPPMIAGEGGVPLAPQEIPTGDAFRAALAQTREEHPDVSGVAAATGSVVGGIATDPRNYPFLFGSLGGAVARRVMLLGFSAQMAQGAIENSKEWARVKDDPSVPKEQKVELGVSAILSGLMAVHGAVHAVASSGKPKGGTQYFDTEQELVDHVGPIFRKMVKEVGVDLPRDATLEQAQAAYKQAMRKVHPDLNPNVDPQTAQQLNAAWDVLKQAGYIPKDTTRPSMQEMRSALADALKASWSRVSSTFSREDKPSAPAEVGESGNLLPQDAGVRPAVQASGNPEELRKSAAEQEPKLQEMAEAAVAPVSGAKFEGSRVKGADSQELKEERGKPSETNIDHVGARVSAQDDAGREQLEQSVEQQLPVVSKDNIDANGLDVTQYGVKTGKPGEPNQVAELQVTDKDNIKAMEASEDLYRQQKEALAKGDQAEADRIGAQIEAKHAEFTGQVAGVASIEDIQSTSYNPPSNEGGKQEVEPKYKHGSTQANIPPDSQAAKGLDVVRKQIPQEHLAGKGTDIDANHVTVRFGLDGDEDKVRAYLEQQAPFEAKLGKSEKFAPSESSDGAAVIQAPIEAPELHRMNAEIEKIGKFAPSNFPDYKPHATIAYVKPEVADKYVGMNATEGKTFKVDQIAITDRDGNQQVVKLNGASGQRGEPASPQSPATASSTSPAKSETPAVSQAGKQTSAQPQPESTTRSNRDRFAESYQKHLAADVEKNPKVYAYPKEKVPEVARRMVAALAGGSGNKSSPAIRATLKELGVKDTYAAIREFLNAKTEATNEKPATQVQPVAADKKGPEAQAQPAKVPQPAKEGESDLEAARRGAAGEPPKEAVVNQVPVEQRPSTTIAKEEDEKFAQRVAARQEPAKPAAEQPAEPLTLTPPPEDIGVKQWIAALPRSERGYAHKAWEYLQANGKDGLEGEIVPSEYGIEDERAEAIDKHLVVILDRTKARFTVKKADIVPTPEGSYEAIPQEPTVEKPVEASESSPLVPMVDAVYQKLSHGESLGNVTELNKLAESILGASRTSGQWTPRDVFDAMEAGVNKYLLDRGRELMAMPVEEGLKELKSLESRLTSQGTRTEEQLTHQQFSTPPRESYVAARVANLKPSDVVLEPSAGNGGLAVWPKAIGAEVHVNEIAPRRQKMLEAAGFGSPTAHDGELINAHLDRSIRPTVIVMNPPFSAKASAGGMGENNAKYGFNHVNQALQRLEPNGRLVAILGGGRDGFPREGASMVPGTASRDWFDQLSRKYNIRANVRVSGKEYQKYGTSYATRIIVIDKDGSTKSLNEIVQGNVDTLEQAYNALRNVAESRPLNVIGQSTRPTDTLAPDRSPSDLGTGARPRTEPAGSGAPEPVRPAGRPAPIAGPRGPQGVSSGNEPTARPQSLPVREPGVQPQERPAGAAAPGAGSSNENATERPLGSGDSRGLSPTPHEKLDLTQEGERNDREEEDSGAYVAYKPSIQGPAHPGDIVESKTMSTVPLPKITYKPSLPASFIKDSKLSAVQLEAVAIAGQQNQIILPGEFRGSALVGDGTGVGKGRIGAGVLYDNWNQGRKRLVWVSEKWDLMQDAIRDLKGIGALDLAGRIKPFDKFKVTNPIEHEGVLFTTYALLRSADKQGNTRIGQFERWIRGNDNADGAYILYDESHNLKNAVVGVGRQKPSQIGKAIKEFMERVPNLRSSSLSATAASDVMNLGYLDRLGLWGPGTPFPNGFTQFAAEIGQGGISAMEMIARELKAQGKYVARTLSYRGVTYDMPEHKLTEDQKDVYRTAAKAWRSVQQVAEETIKTTLNGGGIARGNFLSQFYGAQQRFFNLLITTLKIPTAVEMATKDLEEGKSVIITLVNTNEAAQNREKAKVAAEDRGDDEPPDYDFGPKNLLIDLVKNHFPTQQWEDAVDDQGRPYKKPVSDADGHPVTNPDAERERDQLIAKLDKELHMPDNPLDILINSLGGPNKVAELTGRKERVDSSTGKLLSRGGEGVPRDKVNLAEQAAFQSGKKRVGVLSNAAGTGISLHAGLDVKNQQKRSHYTLQAGWSADKAMQMLGRSHRTNQAQPPEYHMLVSDLGGEKRFIASIARRLGSLGALSRGQKNATSGTDAMDKFNFESNEGRSAAKAFYDGLMRRGAALPGTSLTGMDVLREMGVLKIDRNQGETVPDADRTNVTRLLNRILSLDPDTQNAAYDYYYDVFQAVVQRAIDDGTLDTGVRTLPGDSFHVKEERAISKDPQTGAKTFYYPVQAEVRIQRMSPADLDKAWRKQELKKQNPRILIDDKGKLTFAYDAKPVVHADGSSSPASYIASPGNGNPTKVENSRIYRHQEIGEWAEDKLEAARRSLSSGQGDLDYWQQYGSGPFKESRTREAQQKITKAQQEIDDAQAAAADPQEWAKELWQKQYDASPSHTQAEHHLIGGAVMRWWNPIREATGESLHVFTTLDSKSGKRVVGVEIPPEKIRNLLDRVTGGESTVNAEQLITDVLKNNLTYTLEGNIQARRGRVASRFVLELIPSNQDVATNLKRMGVLYEKGLRPIYYVPSHGELGGGIGANEKLVKAVLDEYPVKTEQGGANAGEGSNAPVSQAQTALRESGRPDRNQPQAGEGNSDQLRTQGGSGYPQAQGPGAENGRGAQAPDTRPLNPEPIKIDRHNTGSALEKKLEAYTAANAEKLVRDFFNQHTDAGGTVNVSTDAAKRMFQENIADPVGTDDDVRGSAFALHKAVWYTALKRPVPPGREGVVILTGSPGSGKTSASESIASVDIKREMLLTDRKEALEAIQEILDSGRKAMITGVFLDDPKEAVRRMIKRAVGTPEMPGIGRTVKVDYMGRAYVEIPKTLKTLKDRFGDKLEMRAIDNSGEPGSAKVYNGVDEMVQNASNWTVESAREAMHEELDRLREEGQVPDATYRAANEPELEGDRGQGKQGVGGRSEQAPSQQERGVLSRHAPEDLPEHISDDELSDFLDEVMPPAESLANFDEDMRELDKYAAGKNREKLEGPERAYLVPEVRAAARRVFEAVDKKDEAAAKQAGHDLYKIFRDKELESQGDEYGVVLSANPVFNPRNWKRFNQAYDDAIQKFIDRGLKIGDKYYNVKDYDPQLADNLHLLDNAPRYMRDKAQANLDTAIKGLSEEQVRLASLMVDSDSRDYLKDQKPAEYQRATNDQDVMAAVKRFEPLQQELTDDRKALGWPIRLSLSAEEDVNATPGSSDRWKVVDRDGSTVATARSQAQAQAYIEQNAKVEPHLKRTYPEHLRQPLPFQQGEAGKQGPYAGSFYNQPGIRPPKMDKKQRLASAEYHYEHGAKDFSGYIDSYRQTKEAMLKQSIFDDFTQDATKWTAGTAQPPQIDYNGKDYYRPEIARKMREGGAKNVEEYSIYDPTRGERFMVKNFEEGWAVLSTGKPGISAQERWLAPKVAVDALEKYDAGRGGSPSSIRRFFQEQIVGMFGPMVHINNIVRRLAQVTGVGTMDPRSWPSIMRMLASGALRDRLQRGVNDDTIDLLTRRGAYTDWHDVGNLHAYWGGNFNPFNWVRSFGKGVLFDPKFAGGWGGLDPKARVLVADYLRENAPGISDQQIADTVNDAMGNYNRANWTERQRKLAYFTIFPGWDSASAKWFLRHPIITAIVPALAVMLANLALNALKKNKDQDKFDFSYLHYGDRKYRTGLVNDTMGMHLAQPVLEAGKSALEGGDAREVAGAVGQGLIDTVSGLAAYLRPDAAGLIELISNRESLGRSKEIFSPGDEYMPGKVLPNRKLDKLALHATLRAFPAARRFLAPDQSMDAATGVGSIVGVTNYRYGAEERLRANEAKARGYSETMAKLAATDPEAAEQMAQDADKSAYLVFHGDLATMLKDLREIDTETQRVKGADLPSKERDEALNSLQNARLNLLTSADALSDALFQMKEQRHEDEDKGSARSLLNRLRGVSSQSDAATP